MSKIYLAMCSNAEMKVIVLFVCICEVQKNEVENKNIEKLLVQLSCLNIYRHIQLDVFVCFLSIWSIHICLFLGSTSNDSNLSMWKIGFRSPFIAYLHMRCVGLICVLFTCVVFSPQIRSRVLERILIIGLSVFL